MVTGVQDGIPIGAKSLASLSFTSVACITMATTAM